MSHRGISLANEALSGNPTRNLISWETQEDDLFRPLKTVRPTFLNPAKERQNVGSKVRLVNEIDVHTRLKMSLCG